MAQDSGDRVKEYHKSYNSTIKLIRKYWGPALYLSACMIFLLMDFINDRLWLSDFEVYYRSAARLIDGITLYRHPEDLHYVFKYSPVSALYFTPYLWLSFDISKIIYWISLSLYMVAGYMFLLKSCDEDFLRSGQKHLNWIFLILIPATGVHFLRELHLGQVNHLILVVYFLMLYLYQNSRYVLAGTLLSFSFFLKPFSLIFIPYFILKRQYNVILSFLFSSVVFFMLPLPLYGSWTIHLSEYLNWFNELVIELGNKQDLFSDGNHTIFSILARYSPLGIIAGSHQLLYQLLILAALAISLLIFITKGNGVVRSAPLDITVLAALIPLMAFTSSNAFIYSSGLIVILLLNWSSLFLVEKTLAVSGFMLTGVNFAEILGKAFSEYLSATSAVSIATLLLVIVAFSIRLRRVS